MKTKAELISDWALAALAEREKVSKLRAILAKMLIGDCSCAMCEEARRVLEDTKPETVEESETE